MTFAPLRMTMCSLAALLAAIPAALAGASDFAFEPVSPTVKAGAATLIAVRLIDTRSKQPVPGAVIFRTQLDMSPDDMAGMLASHKPAPSDEPGVYRFTADLSMAGRWALSLQAKAPGESETIDGRVIFEAKD